MIELIKEILTKFGVPGMIISVIVFLISIKPITLITSNSIEAKLLSKEKRISVTAIKYICGLFLITLMFIFITDTFFQKKEAYHSWIEIILFVLSLCGTIPIIIFDIKSKTFFDIFKNSKKSIQISFFLLTIVCFSLWIVVPTYYIGTQLYSDFYNKSLNNSQQFGVFLAVSILYLFISISSLPLYSFFYNFLDIRRFNPNNIKSKIFYIELDNSKKWYLFHPTNKNQYFLGNEMYLKDCTEFKFIEVSELLKMTIKVASQ